MAFERVERLLFNVGPAPDVMIEVVSNQVLQWLRNVSKFPNKGAEEGGHVHEASKLLAVDWSREVDDRGNLAVIWQNSVLCEKETQVVEAFEIDLALVGGEGPAILVEAAEDVLEGGEELFLCLSVH